MKVIILSLFVTFASQSSVTADHHASAEEEAQIRRAARSYLTALQKGSPAEIAAYWTADGVYVDVYHQARNAQEVIAEAFAELTPEEQREFETEVAKGVAADDSTTIRLVAPGVALEESVGATGAAQSADFLAVWVKPDADWKLAFLREFAAGDLGPLASLDQLDWMIGHWKCEHDNLQAEFQAALSDDNKFILQDYSIRAEGLPEVKGHQRIGVDPSENVIRSWAFRGGGGFSEGRWMQEGDAWAVDFQGTLPAGEKSQSLDLWIPEGDDRCWLKSVKPVMPGQESPVLLLEFVRVKE